MRSVARVTNSSTSARAALEAVAESYSLALVTNGASCLQREKLQAVGLSEYFESVVVSSDLGVAKPSVAIFAHALDQLRVKGEHATMVGDSLTRDVEGAIAAGLRGIWLGPLARTTTPHQTDRLDRTLNADRVACHPRELTVQASKPAISATALDIGATAVGSEVTAQRSADFGRRPQGSGYHRG